MATEVDIANTALAHLGDRATVSSLSPPEGSPQAEHAARFYPIARDVMLELHPWRFATRRQALADASLVTPPPSQWAYSYSAPLNLAVLAVFAPDATDERQTMAFVVEVGDDGSQVIFTNQEDAVVQFTLQVTDTTKFSPLFIEALGYLLASYLAGPIIKGADGMKASADFKKMAFAVLSSATTADANNRDKASIRDDLAARPSWLSDRSAVSDYQYR